MNAKGLPWEEAAEHVENVAGWACKTCHKFYGASGERAARYCCASDAPCACGGRREKHYTVCRACHDRMEDERYWALPEVDWDGETPLVTHRGDTYLWNTDDLAEYLDNCEFPYPVGEEPEEEPETDAYHAYALEHVHLCLCRSYDRPKVFDLVEHVYDYDEECELDAEGLAAEKAVNDWLEKYRVMWTEDRKRPSLASLRLNLGLVSDPNEPTLPGVETED